MVPFFTTTASSSWYALRSYWLRDRTAANCALWSAKLASQTIRKHFTGKEQIYIVAVSAVVLNRNIYKHRIAHDCDGVYPKINTCRKGSTCTYHAQALQQYMFRSNTVQHAFRLSTNRQHHPYSILTISYSKNKSSEVGLRRGTTVVR